MNTKTIETTSKLLKLRNTLQTIGNASFSFSKLNTQFPIDTLDEAQAKQLIAAYEEIIKEVKKAIDI